MTAALVVASILLSSQVPATESARPIPASSKKLGESAPADPSPVGFVVWTFAVLGAMAGGVALLRRFLGSSPRFAAGGAIAVLARRSVGPRQDLLLVEAGGRRFLIGATRERLTTLGEFQNADEPPEDGAQASRERESLGALSA